MSLLLVALVVRRFARVRRDGKLRNFVPTLLYPFWGWVSVRQFFVFVVRAIMAESRTVRLFRVILVVVTRQIAIRNALVRLRHLVVLTSVGVWVAFRRVRPRRKGEFPLSRLFRGLLYLVGVKRDVFVCIVVYCRTIQRERCFNAGDPQGRRWARG